MRILLILFLIFPAALHAQIYADFTVSSGGSSLGTFRVLLEHEKAPRTCANFIGLASGKRPWIDLTNGAVRTDTPYYDGLTFHRLIHSFVIQGGSPNGQGNDGPGYTILDEYHPDLRHSSDYVLSMAKSNFPNTGGSQFFITLRATPELNDKHSVFGRVISGTAIIDGFKNPALFPTGDGDVPVDPIVMNSVVISGPSYAGFDLNAASLRLPHVSGTDMRISRNTAAATMTATFDRRPKTDYMLLQSPDLATWSAPRFILSLDSEVNQELVITSRPEPSYFLNLATVGYDQIPNAPADLVEGAKKLRLKFVNGQYIDFMFNGENGGTWFDSAQNRTGNLADTVWLDQAGETGTLETASSVPFAIPLGALGTTLLDYPNIGVGIRLEVWVSCQTGNSGWLEEYSADDNIRYAFEILSN
jgi:peptidyl-prolyl cis-trans isomerase A (cyclophilin A)